MFAKHNSNCYRDKDRRTKDNKKREPMIREMDEKQIAQIPSSEARAKEINCSE
jgi:hypothetical protein